MSWSETLFLKKIIDGQKSLVVSDNLYKKFDVNVSSESSVESKNLQLFKVKNDGSFKISVEVWTSSRSASVYIYKNGSVVDTISCDSINSTDIYFSSPIIANKNDVFGFGISGYIADLTDLSIYADIVDNSLIKTL